MRNTYIVKNPGFMYDLFGLFSLYFNKEFWFRHFSNRYKKDEDIDFWNTTISKVTPISNVLKIFFYIKETRCFITEFCFEKYKSEFFDSYDFSTVLNCFEDSAQVVDSVLKFYFPDISDKKLEMYRTNPTCADELINDSELDFDIKCGIYSLILNPDKMINTLCCELKEKKKILEEMYKKELPIRSMLKNGVDASSLLEKLSKCGGHSVELSSFNDIYFTFCYICKNAVVSFVFDKKAIIVLGVDYSDELDSIMDNDTPELDVFCNALAEPNRLKILELILENGEISIKDIEDTLGLTGTNSYYHISMLTKAHALNCRNRGKTVYYSINDRCFKAAIGMLREYFE